MHDPSTPKIEQVTDDARGRRTAGLALVLIVVFIGVAIAKPWGSPPASTSLPPAPVGTLGAAVSPSPAPTGTAVPTPVALSPPSGSIVPWIDATPTPVPSPTPVLIPPGTQTCVRRDLTATAGWQGATGSMAGWLAVTNAGQRPCVLNGSPRLIRLRSGTTILEPLTYTAGKDAGPGNQTGSAEPVLLRPGDQAGAFLLWTNWCSTMLPDVTVTALLLTLPTGGSPVVASPTSPGPGFFGTPRCDQPSSGSTLTAYAFVPVPPPTPVYEPQAASVALSVPQSATSGGDLAYLVTLTNLGATPALLSPCPTYTEDLIVDGRALKPPAPQQFLLNCTAIGRALAPAASVTLQMHYAVPSALPPGPVEVVWGLDPGGPFDASTAVQRASITVVGP